MKRLFVCLFTAFTIVAFSSTVRAGDDGKFQLVITGGHETDPRDHGRPVILISNALGVTPDVFREAFSRVKPASAGEQPDADQVRRNKAVLLQALGPYRVTNELLDQVSDYYRYRPESGTLWPTTPAIAFVTLTNGVPVSIVVIVPGSGYCSPPQISVPGHPEILLTPTLAFGRDLKTNGSLASIAVAGADQPAR